MKKTFDSIEAVVADLKRGKMVIVVDDADRENEGDLVMAAQSVTSAAVNFMAKHGRGLICVPTTGERLQQLGIDRMVQQNRESFRTDFQVSVDAARGIGSGISAADRAKTICVMASPTALPDDLVQPGHVFPLRAKSGGVLQRAGHTEAAVDLVTLAGARPIGVICEIMNDDGTMARLPALLKFAKKHRLKICTIADLIEFRRTREKLVEQIEVVKLPTDYGDFDLHLYRSKIDGQHHLALVRGDIAGKKDVLVRVHSECLTGDVFGSRRCDSLHAAGRPRHRSCAEDPGLQITGTGARHRRGELETRLRDGPARIWPRCANPRGPRLENHPAADEQSKKSRRAEGLRLKDCRAGADSRETQSAQRTVSENEAGEAGALVVKNKTE